MSPQSVNGVLGVRGVCTYCGKLANTSRDHFYPKSKGGKTMVQCCQRCNQYKADLLPSQWLDRVSHSALYTDEEKTRIIQSTHILLKMIPVESTEDPGPTPIDFHSIEYRAAHADLRSILNQEDPIGNSWFECGILRIETQVNQYPMIRYWRDGNYLGSRNTCNCKHCKGN